MRVRARFGRIGQPARDGLILSIVFLALAPAGFSPVIAASSQDARPSAEAPAVPERNGNIWAGRAHQPSRAEVESSEERSRETTPRQERQYGDEVDKIKRQIEQTEQRYPPGFLNPKP
jgi:hypothetical protein